MITIEDETLLGVPDAHRKFLMEEATWTGQPFVVEGPLSAVRAHWDDALGCAYLKLGVKDEAAVGLATFELQLPGEVSFASVERSLWFRFWVSHTGWYARWSVVYASAGHIHTEFLHGFEWTQPPPGDSFDPVSFLEALRS